MDAIKLDVEGAEDLVLGPFFQAASPALWPRLIAMERNASHGGPRDPTKILADARYREILRTRNNIVYEGS